MDKIYILDNNVVIHDLCSLLNYPDEQVIIFRNVFNELVKIKKKNNYNAFHIRKKIKDFFEKELIRNRKINIVELPNSNEKIEEKILHFVQKIKKENPKKEVILVTYDHILRIKANIYNILTESYTIYDEKSSSTYCKDQ